MMMGQWPISGHTDCCGSECKRFHIGSSVYNSSCSARLYKCVYLLFNAVALIHSSVVWVAMYISRIRACVLTSLCTFRRTWTCRWNLFCSVFCFVARVPGSLAGGFLVAVAGRALFLVVCVLEIETSCVGPIWMFHLLTCTMGSAPIKWTCTVVCLSRDQGSLLTGPYWPQGSRRKKN